MKKVKKISKKPFYYQFISVERLSGSIRKAGLAPAEEKQIFDLVESTIHTRVIDAILEKIPSSKQEFFLEKFTAMPDDESLLQFLREQVADIDQHLRKTFQDLEKEILSDISAS